MEEWDRSMKEERAHQCQPAAQMVASEVVAKARLETQVLVFALVLILTLSPAHVPLASVGDAEVAQVEGNRRCCHLQHLVPGSYQV